MNATRLIGRQAATGLVAAIAVLKALLALTAIASLDSFVHPIPAPVFLLVVLLYALTGGYLVIMGRRDRRAVPLGVFLLLVASSFARRLLDASAAGMPSIGPLLLALKETPVEAFLAFYFWQFVRDFPRRPVQDFGMLKWMPRASLAIGLITLSVDLVGRLGTGDIGPDVVARGMEALEPGGRVYWALIFGAILPGLPFALWRTRWVTTGERRRVRILMAALACGFAPSLIVVILDGLWPSFSRWMDQPSTLPTLGLVIYPALLAIPVVTAYAVLVHEALDVRLLLRKALQYALARYTILFVASIPFIALLVLLYTRRHDTLTGILGSTAGALIALGLIMGFLGLRVRRMVLDALDRRFFREQYDARQILAALVRRIPSVHDSARLEQEVVSAVQQALHIDSVHVMLLDRTTNTLVSPSSRIRPCPRGTALLDRLKEYSGAVHVDWNKPGAVLSDLPRTEQNWLLDVKARLLLPLVVDVDSAIGMIALGEKRSELPFSSEDELLLASIAGALALAFGRQAAPAVGLSAQRMRDAEAARECRACGAVAHAARPSCTRCGAETRIAALPLLLAGKFELLSMLGEGGMGVVYRARDNTLGRDVALKALPRLSAAHAERLRREARAMAAVMHPHLALIFGAESWRGSPVLVVEYLGGGTLASMIRGGQLPCDEAVSLVRAVTEGLERLHSVGILHRDIKPSNIGFAEDGAAKLLDFGLAQVRAGASGESDVGRDGSNPRDPRSGTNDDRVSGTLPYLSPEAVSGEPADASWDLWALAMVLYESIAGRHPIAGGHQYSILARILAADFPDVRAFAPGTSKGVAQFLKDALAADVGRRPATVREFADRLSKLSPQIQRSVA